MCYLRTAFSFNGHLIMESVEEKIGLLHPLCIYDYLLAIIIKAKFSWVPQKI